MLLVLESLFEGSTPFSPAIDTIFLIRIYNMPTEQELFSTINSCYNSEGILKENCEAIFLTARNQIIEMHYKYVCSIAHKKVKKCFNAHPRIEVSDLINAGIFGIIKAISKFDSSRKCSFLTYATNWINFFMQEEVRSNNTIQIPHRIEKLGKKIRNLLEDTNISFTDACKQLNLKEADISRIRCYIYQPVVSCNAGENNFDIETGDTTKELLYMEESRKLHQNIARLPHKEKITILGRLEGKTLEQIGRDMNLTKERSRQLEKNAEERLKKMCSLNCSAV
jgi:RNA polymerase primary sigma factor